MTRLTLSIPRRRRARRGRLAFTLPELLVAIGAVALVVVGIGRIFQSISDLVGTGAALSEVDQMARTIERQLREDFAALNEMAADETFIAIRMREIGDVNRNNEVDGDPAMPSPGNERAIYISLDDREADERDIIDGLFDTPYEEGSRAITTRLDEIMFLAPAPAGTELTSFQTDRAGRALRRAPFARIYYGHALRPAPDPEWPPDPDATDPPRVPRRQFIADGDFGQPVGATNRFTEAFSGALTSAADELDTVAGRNEYAGDWMLARHALLLDGGLAAGPLTSFRDQSGELRDNLEGEQIEYAPFVRDAQTLHRFWENLRATDGAFDHAGPSSLDGDPALPDPRLLRHGRVDVCAQDLGDVRRWLEGESPQWEIGDPVLAAPFDQGLLSRRSGSAYGEWPRDLEWDPQRPDGVQRFLWQRPPNADFLTTFSRPEEAFAANLRGIRSAIAGCFTRLQAEASPPQLDRREVAPGGSLPADPPNAQQPIDPEDALMDSHAIIAENCSRFEIAWTDGSTVREEFGVDFDNDGTPDLQEGDLVWFDITPIDPDDDPDRRATYRQLWEEFGTGADPEIQFVAFSPQEDPFPFPRDNEYAAVRTFPELGYQDWRMPQTPFPSDLLEIAEDDQVDPANNGLPRYNPDLTGGATRGEQEYFAIWPFRLPDESGQYVRPWPKELLFRIRLTLHDSQRRLRGGKDFEFIFNVSLTEN